MWLANLPWQTLGRSKPLDVMADRAAKADTQEYLWVNRCGFGQNQSKTFQFCFVVRTAVRTVVLKVGLKVGALFEVGYSYSVQYGASTPAWLKSNPRSSLGIVCLSTISFFSPSRLCKCLSR